jgi:hypothetical protein
MNDICVCASTASSDSIFELLLSSLGSITESLSPGAMYGVNKIGR